MFSFTPSEDNCVVATRRLLGSLKVLVTPSAIEQKIMEHPYYPSLLSIADSLKQWRVATVALRTTEEKLNELCVPFIVHLKSKGGQFVVVKKLTATEVIYADEQNKEASLGKVGFSQQWDGVVLLAESDKSSGEPGYKKARHREWWRTMYVPAGLLVLIILGILQTGKIIFQAPQSAVYYSLFLLFSLLGMIITVLLLWHEYDQTNSFLHKVCSAGKHSGDSPGNTGCQKVLTSKAAKAIGNLTWSEIGFIYFAGSYLYLLMSGILSLRLLMILNIIALPYIFYSIYYQANVAKQWCVLCLSIQSLLLLEFLSTILTNQLTLSLSEFWQTDVEIFILSFFLPTFIWFFVKPHLYAGKMGKQFQFQLARLKRNKAVFSSLLHKQPMLQQKTDGLGITIGNPNAKNKLIKVCNPYCGPCAQAHPKIEEVIHKNPNWKVQIIFMATGEEEDKRSAPAAHLMAIADQHDELKTQQALDDWYNAKEKSYNVFAEKYPMNGEIKLQKKKLQAMNKWCREVKVMATPTFFVKPASSNDAAGYKLPGQYGIEDLMYL